MVIVNFKLNNIYGLWACLWEIVLILLIDMGRPILILGETIP